MIPDTVFIVFAFLLGSCIGSFLNVVVWRVPRGKSIFWPASACPKCHHHLSAGDNIPVFGWILLGGKCRYCKEPISARYPIIEAITGLLFVLYYVCFFMLQLGPTTINVGDFGIIEHTFLSSIQSDYAIYGVYMLLISGLLASSLIDAELYIIPIEIPWTVALIAFVAFAVMDRPADAPGMLSAGRVGGLMAIGGAGGLLISNLLLWLKVLPQSFAKGDPLLEFEREAMEKELRDQNAEQAEFARLPPVATKSEIRREMLKEAWFVAIPLVLAIATPLVVLRLGMGRAAWIGAITPGSWLSGLLGSMLGAMVAGLSIWITRIGATLVLGRVGMGQGDTHLMIAIGAVMGAGPAVAVFFLAPFCGIAVGVYKWLTKGTHELPYGPYLSLAAGVVAIFYRYIGDYFALPVLMIRDMAAQWFGR